MSLEVNVRERQVSGLKTIQLETCGASAIQCFDKVNLVYIRFQYCRNTAVSNGCRSQLMVGGDVLQCCLFLSLIMPMMRPIQHWCLMCCLLQCESC